MWSPSYRKEGVGFDLARLDIDAVSCAMSYVSSVSSDLWARVSPQRAVAICCRVVPLHAIQHVQHNMHTTRCLVATTSCASPSEACAPICTLA